MLGQVKVIPCPVLVMRGESSNIVKPEEAEAFAEAASAGLSYLPGEVLVKFRDGTTAVAQQRALDQRR